MGRIDHLEVEDFKSYAGKQVIGPFRGFTAVIGPNGAGKSNLMDAISFVLGLQARHLRGNTLKDLVFKVEGATGGPSSASVKLVYVVEDGEVAGKAAGTELVFTRLITPAGVSTYKLDDKEVTHAAYDATLKSIGVLTKARNFLVFQGDVQNMGNMTPDRMLQHLEQISGSHAFKEECDALQAQCAALHEEYTFKRSQRQSVKTEKAALEADKAEAEAYLAAQEQLAHLRLQSFLWQLFHIEGDLSKGAGHIAGLGEELSEAEADEAAATQEVKAGQAQYAASKRRRTAAERSMADLTKAVDKHSTRASEAQNAVVRCGKAVVAQQERLEAAQRDAEAVRGTIAEVEGELSKLAEQITALEGGGGEATGGGGLALTAKQLPEYTKLKAVARQRTVEHRQSVESLEREQAGDKDTLADLSSRVSAFQDRITAAEKDVASSREKIEKYRATQTAESAGIAQATEHVRKLEAELQSDVARQEALASELGEVQAALHEARDVRRSSNEEKAAATALADMKRLYPGVRGRLVDLVAPAQGRFATAVDVALGRLGDAIVVDTGDVAAECIQYLRSHQVRACSFLALDTIRPPEPSPRLAHLSGPFRLATDVIVCEDAPSLPALEFVVGNVVVADSLADATLLRFQRRVVCKVVTLDGSIVAKNGHMTGGVSAKGGGRRRFDEKALAALKSKRDALLSEEEALRRRTGSGPASRGRSKLGRTIESVKNTVKVGQNKLRAISDAMTRMEARVAQRTQELTNIRSELGELTPKVEALTAAVAARQERLDTLHSQVHSAEDEVFADFCAKHGLGSIREYETTVVAAAAARSQELEGLQDAHSKLVSKRDFEASRLADLQRLMTAAETGVLKAQAAEVDAKRALETANADVETARQSLGSALDELEDTQAAFDAAEGAMKAAKRKREVARKAAQDVQKRIAAHDALMEKRRAARHDLLVRARVAQVSIPRVPGAGGGDSADTPASSEEGSAAQAGSVAETGTTRSARFSRASGSVVAQDAAAASTIDFSQLEREVPPGGASPAKVKEVVAEYDRGIAALERKLAGSQPNMKSVEQFTAAADRLAAAAGEERAAKAAHDAALAKLQGVQAQRERLFFACFQAVRDRVERVYADMTRSEGQRGGGLASLYLEQDDKAEYGDMPAGVLYKAQPPNKRSRDMQGLSGGERTVASLALLFAMHDFAPAPFCVLDEVDDALDTGNVRLVCDYIRRRASTAPAAVALRKRAAADAAGRRVSGTPSALALDRPLQCIVISLKNAFYSNADALVGICRDVAVDCSRVLTLDLETFVDHAPLAATSRQQRSKAVGGGVVTPLRAGRRATVLPTHASTPGGSVRGGEEDAASVAGSESSRAGHSSRFRRGQRFRRGGSETGSVISEVSSAASSVMHAAMRRLSGAGVDIGVSQETTVGGAVRPRIQFDDDEEDEAAGDEAATQDVAQRSGTRKSSRVR